MKQGLIMISLNSESSALAKFVEDMASHCKEEIKYQANNKNMEVDEPIIEDLDIVVWWEASCGQARRYKGNLDRDRGRWYRWY